MKLENYGYLIALAGAKNSDRKVPPRHPLQRLWRLYQFSEEIIQLHFYGAQVQIIYRVLGAWFIFYLGRLYNLLESGNYILILPRSRRAHKRYLTPDLTLPKYILDRMDITLS